MSEKSRLEHLVDGLNIGIKATNFIEIDFFLWKLEDEGFITEHEANGIFDDILNGSGTFPYSSFIKEDK
ncbi:hypothetical protein [Mammaliicoccus sciuri]|uniref:hypothetical protein n=1 Tax=Mammaliicoccus sciuri TaxID=1296 RepID=UPI001C4E6F3D|nr:hypothetical protein [Mammaliicoccus sciuri]